VNAAVNIAVRAPMELEGQKVPAYLAQAESEENAGNAAGG
jgi:hypothetical protein